MYLFFHVHVNVHTHAHIQLQHHIARTQDRQEFNIIEFCFVIKDHFYKHHKKISWSGYKGVSDEPHQQSDTQPEQNTS